MFPHPISGPVVSERPSADAEHKYDGETDRKEMKHHKHRKPGSLGRKVSVAAKVVGAKMAPAGEWLKEKGNAVLPEQVTHAQEKEAARIRREHEEAAASADLGAPVHPKEELPSLQQAADDVALHTAESFHNRVMVPLNNQVIAPLDHQVVRPGVAQAQNLARRTSASADQLASSIAKAFHTHVGAPLQEKVGAPLEARWAEWTRGVVIGQMEAHKAAARNDRLGEPQLHAAFNTHNPLPNDLTLPEASTQFVNARLAEADEATRANSVDRPISIDGSSNRSSEMREVVA